MQILPKHMQLWRKLWNKEKNSLLTGPRGTVQRETFTKGKVDEFDESE